MIAATHVTVGAAVGLWAVKLAENIGLEQEPLKIAVALIAGTLSHYMLDAIPHSDAIYNTRIGIWSVLAVELFIITIAVFSLSFFRSLPLLVILFGFIGGAWPDFISILINFMDGNKVIIALNGFHDFWHSSCVPALIPSITFQLALVVISLFFLI